jgi:hypothetical protein
LGPDRRRRRTYVTRNTEYHVDDRVCIAVRDRATGRWQLSHPALRRKLEGSLRCGEAHDPFPSLEPPRPGDALFFASDGEDVLTSHLVSIERPEPTTIAGYPV